MPFAMKSAQRLENTALDSSGSYRVGRDGGWSLDANACSVALRDCSTPNYRGGGFSSVADYCSVANRFYNSPYDRSYILGFRVVRTAN